MAGVRETRRAGIRARRLQTGRFRTYAMAFALGLGVLVILAWGMTWG